MWPWIVGGTVVLLVLFWPPTPAALSRLVRRLIGYLAILRRAKRNRIDLARWLLRRPTLFAVVNAYEGAIFTANGVDTRLKYLASLRASSLAGCPF